jgi:pilus assembly protein Flp/PilA
LAIPDADGLTAPFRKLGFWREWSLNSQRSTKRVKAQPPPVASPALVHPPCCPEPTGCGVAHPVRRVIDILDNGSTKEVDSSPAGGEERMFRTMMNKTVRFLKKEDGPTAVEYAVMLALIIVVCIAAITTLGTNANRTFGNVALNTSGS